MVMLVETMDVVDNSTKLNKQVTNLQVPSKKLASDQSSTSSDDAATRLTSTADIQTGSSVGDEWETLSSDVFPSIDEYSPKKRIGKVLQKTTLCKHFLKGRCRFEDKCSFAHDPSEIQAKPNLEKTRLCTHFKAGYCKKDNCKYAHGVEELNKRPEAAEAIEEERLFKAAEGETQGGQLDPMQPRLVQTSAQDFLCGPVPHGSALIAEPMKVSFQMAGCKVSLEMAGVPAQPQPRKPTKAKAQKSQRPALKPGLQKKMEVPRANLEAPEMWWPNMVQDTATYQAFESMVGEYLRSYEYEQMYCAAAEDNARVENLLNILQTDQFF